jgi:hypothetical protein
VLVAEAIAEWRTRLARRNEKKAVRCSVSHGV